jgi:TonB-dependent starch-binding outer membrane protein SusC
MNNQYKTTHVMSRLLFLIRLKLILFLLMSTSLSMFAQLMAKAQTHEPKTYQSYEIKRTNLKDLLSKLEKTYQVKFNYKSTLINKVEVEALPIQEFNERIVQKLNQVLSDVDLECKAINNSSFVVVAREKMRVEPLKNKPTTSDRPSTSTENVRPPVKVSGMVMDENNQPMIGVSVAVKGTTRGTTTDKSGNYTIEAPDNNSILVFTFVGYLTQSATVNTRSLINISMQPDTKSLNEVVVVGYGTRLKKDVSGAVTQINAASITNQPITSVDQGLAGLVPGVTLREGSGAPGSGPEILIRGINTLGNNRPLIVIDDVIIETSGDPSRASIDAQNNNPLALVNPEDIENVTILKDAATKAIYGSRATAGVIIVTTKKGKKGTPTIRFNSSYGVQSILPFEKPNVMNATELANFYREVNIDRIRGTKPAQYGDPSIPVPDSELPVQFQGDMSRYGVGTNWFDEVTRQAAFQNHNISVNGGTDNATYYVSANYQDQEGVVLFNDFKRYSFRSNLDFKLSKKLRMGLNFSPSRTERSRSADEPGAGQFSAYSTITSTYWADPTATVRDANGNYNFTTRGALTTSWTANPVYQLEAEKEVRKNTQLLTNLYLEFAPIKNLTLRTALSHNYNQAKSTNFQPAALPGDGTLNAVSPNVEGARATSFTTIANNVIWDNTAKYQFKIGEHNFSAMGGFSLQQVITETSLINVKRIIDENFQLVDYRNVDRSVIGNYIGSDEFGESRLVSYISRFNYEYKNKYSLNASLRRDGSSRFGRGVKYGNFPAGSIGWRISEEPFMKNIKNGVINDLRLELGYGITGNNNISNYGHLGGTSVADYVFGSTVRQGTFLISYPNPTVTWEESKQLDFGITAGLFRNRVNFTLNLYRQETVGNLAQISTSWITGVGNVVGNQNSVVENKGFEVDLNVIAINKNGLKWTTGLNASAYRNRLSSYPDAVGFRSGNAGNGTQITWTKPGEPIGMLIGYQFTGLFTQAEIDDPTVPKYAGVRVGSAKWVDGDGDGILEIPDDYVILANPHPDLMFGWNNTVEYKGISLRAIFAGQLGGAIYDLRKEIMYNVDGNFNVDRAMANRWRPGSTDFSVDNFPTTYLNTNRVRFPGSNKIYDGSYLALKNLTIAYDFNRLLKGKARFAKSLELVGSVRNVFYIANYKDGNPEVRRTNDGSALRSVNYGSYPTSRTYTLGLNVTF